MARVLGVDLSFTATGLATKEKHWKIGRKGKATETEDETGLRITDLFGEILNAAFYAFASPIHNQHDTPVPVDLVVIEGPSYGSSGAAAYDLGGLWWYTYIGLRAQNFKVLVVPPANLKIFAIGKGGTGNSKDRDKSAPTAKEQVNASAIRRFTQFPTICDNNEVDAAWLMAIGHYLLGDPVVDVPKDWAERAVAKLKFEKPDPLAQFE